MKKDKCCEEPMPHKHLNPRAPNEEEKVRAMLESIVHEADADIWSEKDSKRVLVRRESIEAARKLLKLK